MFALLLLVLAWLVLISSVHSPGVIGVLSTGVLGHSITLFISLSVGGGYLYFGFALVDVLSSSSLMTSLTNSMLEAVGDSVCSMYS